MSTNPLQKPEISQKEYLKRYLSKDKGEKKKKKVKISSSSHIKRSVIIDDDLGLPSVASVEDEEFNLDYLGDEAPQIAGIIDERPPEIKAKESYGDKNKWKPVGDPGGLDFASHEQSISNGLSNNTETAGGVSSGKRKHHVENTSHGEGGGSNSDFSLPRKNKYDDRTKKRKGSDSDISPPRKNKYDERTKRKGSDSDVSPPRKTKNVKRAKRKGSDSDLSPPRKNKYDDRSKRKGSDSDFSPSRKTKNVERARRKGSDSDLSPPRKTKNVDRARRKGSDSDLSPPRKTKNIDRGRRKGSDSDLSPRKTKNVDRGRREGSDSDLSPPRKTRDVDRGRRKGSNYDLFPPKKSKYKATRYASDSDMSPPRKTKREEKDRREGSDSDLSPPRKNRNKDRAKWREDGPDFSSSKNNHERNDRRNPKDSSRTFHGKNNQTIDENSADKTLGGKKAGLQDAKNLKDELRKLKEQEEALFEKMKASVSGKTAAVVKRDKRTGKIRDVEKEKEEEVQKSARVSERENKYARWGKGLKQIEEAEERVADYLHEVNKPLARYADDQDLDRMLKAREREGDPMLDYIRNKQAESVDVDNRGKPAYQGYYLPNRFNIRPGHRWDGVDRSNGYEKQWFEKQNARKALQEEAYKWSTSDM